MNLYEGKNGGRREGGEGRKVRLGRKKVREERKEEEKEKGYGRKQRRMNLNE